MPEEIVTSPLGVSSIQSGELDEAKKNSHDQLAQKAENVSASPSGTEVPVPETPVSKTPASEQLGNEKNASEINAEMPATASPNTTMMKEARKSAELADISREMPPHGGPPTVITALKTAKDEDKTEEPLAASGPNEDSHATKPVDQVAQKTETDSAVESRLDRNKPATPRTPYRSGQPAQAKKKAQKDTAEESVTPALEASPAPDVTEAENTPSVMSEAEPTLAGDGENNQASLEAEAVPPKSGGGILSLLCCCCGPSGASDDTEITASDLKEELKATSQEDGALMASNEATEPIILPGALADAPPTLAPAEAPSPSAESHADEPTPSVLVTTPKGAGRPLDKPEVMPPLPVAEALKEEATGLGEDVKYADYKARFPETPEEELLKWSAVSGCYLILDTGSNKFFTQWSRKSIPKALALFTVSAGCVEPTRQLNASEKIGLLVERGAIKKLCKSAMVAFCKQAAKYDGYFTLLNTTLWQEAGLGNLEVVWMNSDDTLSFTKRGTEPVDLEKIKPLAVAAVDNTFRLQGTKPRRRLNPKWNKQSFISTVRSITDSAYGEIDPRSKAPRT